MATGNSMMKLVSGSGWSRGLKNALLGELRRWFNTRTWWSQIIIWAASINLIFLMVSISAPQADMPGGSSLTIFNIFLGLVGPIGVSIIMQSVIVGEKRSGTAAWLLSKPISRTAFILSKLIANTAGITATMIAAQGIFAYLIAALVLHYNPPLLGFIAALGVHLVNVFFYMTLTLMLGAIFEKAGPVIGIPMAFIFAQNFAGSIYPPLINLLPWTLVIPLNNSDAPSLAMALMGSGPLPSLLPLFSTLAVSAVFVIVALLVFEKKEL